LRSPISDVWGISSGAQYLMSGALAPSPISDVWGISSGAQYLMSGVLAPEPNI
ncbi:hypothetical protein Bpfe_011073, partial [Biomphalaria pfeifferi]